MEFVKSERGQDKLNFNGYSYVVHKRAQNTGNISWRCINFQKKCPGRMVTCDNNIITVKKHNHSPLMENIRKPQLTSELSSDRDDHQINPRQDVTNHDRTIKSIDCRTDLSRNDMKVKDRLIMEPVRNGIVNKMLKLKKMQNSESQECLRNNIHEKTSSLYSNDESGNSKIGKLKSSHVTDERKNDYSMSDDSLDNHSSDLSPNQSVISGIISSDEDDDDFKCPKGIFQKRFVMNRKRKRFYRPSERLSKNRKIRERRKLTYSKPVLDSPPLRCPTPDYLDWNDPNDLVGRLRFLKIGGIGYPKEEEVIINQLCKAGYILN